MSQMTERFLLLNCANSSFLSFIQIKARNDHPLPLDNNDIMSCGIMQKKKGYALDESL